MYFIFLFENIYLLFIYLHVLNVNIQPQVFHYSQLFKGYIGLEMVRHFFAWSRFHNISAYLPSIWQGVSTIKMRSGFFLLTIMHQEQKKSLFVKLMMIVISRLHKLVHENLKSKDNHFSDVKTLIASTWDSGHLDRFKLMDFINTCDEDQDN